MRLHPHERWIIFTMILFSMSAVIKAIFGYFGKGVSPGETLAILSPVVTAVVAWFLASRKYRKPLKLTDPNGKKLGSVENIKSVRENFEPLF